MVFMSVFSNSTIISCLFTLHWRGLPTGDLIIFPYHPFKDTAKESYNAIHLIL